MSGISSLPYKRSYSNVVKQSQGIPASASLSRTSIINCTCSHKPRHYPLRRTIESSQSSMPDPPQPESPTQGEADADSAPDPIQEITNIRNEPTDIDLRQILAKQEVGKFDFDRDFGVIKNEDDFERRLREFNTMDDKPMEDDETEPRSDFPVDPKIQRRYVLRVGKAILNMEGATDKKIKDRKPASKSWKASAKSKANVPAEEDPGDKEKNSTAVTFLSGLKSAEVELASWKIVVSLETLPSRMQREDLC